MSKDKRKSEPRADEAVKRAAAGGIALNCQWGWAYYDPRIQAAMKRGWLRVERYGTRRSKKTVAKLTESGQQRFEWITSSKES